MTPEQKELVRASFDSLLPVAQSTAELFYSRLFETNPSLRPMFMSDMRGQARKFISMVRVVVTHMDQIDQVTPAVEAMGRRHSGYGVENRHYEAFGKALTWAMEETLGPAFDAQTRDAWMALYASLADSMKRAAAETNEPQPVSRDAIALVAH